MKLAERNLTTPSPCAGLIATSSPELGIAGIVSQSRDSEPQLLRQRLGACNGEIARHLDLL